MLNLHFNITLLVMSHDNNTYSMSAYFTQTNTKACLRHKCRTSILGHDVTTKSTGEMEIGRYMFPSEVYTTLRTSIITRLSDSIRQNLVL